VADRLTKVIFCHNAQLLKNSLPPDDPKPITATGICKAFEVEIRIAVRPQKTVMKFEESAAVIDTLLGRSRTMSGTSTWKGIPAISYSRNQR
jgi:hypothetical protein